VNPDGKVLMRVEPQVSSVSPTPINLGNGINAPAFNVQTVQTTVLASDGETIVLGGLIMGGKRIMLELARHDALTGLVNRRAFGERLDESLRRSGSV